MTQYVSLFDSLHMFKYVNSTNPIGMEPLGFGYGYVLYSTVLSNLNSPTAFTIIAMQDRALVYLNGIYQGILGWAEPDAPSYLTLGPTTSSQNRLDILVENKGRPSGEVESYIFARKGINGQVTLNNKPVTGWVQYLLPISTTF